MIANMFSSVSLSTIAIASTLLSTAQATYLRNELSFGHEGHISPNGHSVPKFHISGKPDPPQILSNKLVLTPPAPGNQRGAVWSEEPLLHSQWTVDVDFRATGPERGGGNFNIWYAKSGQNDIGTSGIYTVGKFDGLALVVDQYAGSGGFIRGFLNDGSKDYKSHHSVDSLAFGHCEYSYRNLGRPSRITLRHAADSFKVTVDGKPCFESPKIKLPRGNFFGLSAASAENPDSFEVFKFVTTTDQHAADSAAQQEIHDTGYGAAKAQPRGEPPATNGKGGTIPSYSEADDVPASQFHSSAEQFADLHNRLQSMMKHIMQTNRHFADERDEMNRKHDALMAKLQSLEASIKIQEGTPNIMKDVQSDVRQTKADLHEALNQHAAGIKGAVQDTHHNVIGTMAKSGNGLGTFALVVIASQVVVVGAYVVYKRRRANNHMKYL